MKKVSTSKAASKTTKSKPAKAPRDLPSKKSPVGGLRRQEEADK